MTNTILITANWHTGALSQQTISRQYDNNRYAVRFVGYPEASDGNELDYYLLVWMSTAPGQKPGEITPIQLNSDQWYISNYFTQQVQAIKFQLCVLNEAGTYEAHSPIFSGRIGDSLEHDGTSHDIDVSTLFDAYREYLNELIIGAGAVIIDPVPTQGSTNAVSSGGVYEAIHDTDPTLTRSGQAADAKVVGDEIATKVSKPVSSPNGTAGQLLRTNGDGTTQWVDQGSPTDEQTAEAIDEWLTDHPEATTTVQDGSLTEAKFSDTLKLATIKDYVTPEMFGARGDGTVDDTVAIQTAINTGKTVILFGQTYKITDTLLLGNRNRINFYQLGGQIHYTGVGYAVEVQNVNGGNLVIDRIYAPNGNCIKFNGCDGHGVQYVNFHFLWLSCNETNGTAIRVENDATGWCSQNNVYGGEVQACKYGIYAEVNANAEHACNQWQIYNVGFEGTVPNEVCITLHGTATMPIRYWSIINPRSIENTQSMLLDLENVVNFSYSGQNGIASRRIQITGTNVYGDFNVPLVSDNELIMLAYFFYISKGVILKKDEYDVLSVNTANIKNYVSGTCYLDTIDENIWVHGNLKFSQTQRQVFASTYTVPENKVPLNRNPWYIPFYGGDGSIVMVQFFADGTTYAQNAALQADVKYYFSATYPKKVNIRN